jgi:uncharacterized membrane protein YhaH (DUF805 family)
MQTFFVLGLIPGTNIQISFQAWLGIMAFLISTIAIYRRRLHGRNETFSSQWQRSLLHASQLHQRVQ